MNLFKCYDTLDHDIIIAQYRKQVCDGRVLKLLLALLGSGKMVGDSREAMTIGSLQGGVISPLIANVYLDNFDQFMKSRDYRIIPDADDILTLCRSETAAQNALKVASRYFEGTLELTVNQTKTRIAHGREGTKFLGVTIFKKCTSVQEKKLLLLKLKHIRRRNTGNNIEGVTCELNPVLRGFSNYFRIANCLRELRTLMGWVRRRLCSI